MSINRINIQLSAFVCSGGPDEEEKAIMRKLLAYGIQPTGIKSIDKATLREIELKQAKEETCVTNKFLTVSVFEQEKIQEHKKEIQKLGIIDDTKQEIKDNFKGAEILGVQLYLAQEMKKKKNLT